MRSQVEKFVLGASSGEVRGLSGGVKSGGMHVMRR